MNPSENESVLPESDGSRAASVKNGVRKRWKRDLVWISNKGIISKNAEEGRGPGYDDFRRRAPPKQTAGT